MKIEDHAFLVAHQLEHWAPDGFLLEMRVADEFGIEVEVLVREGDGFADVLRIADGEETQAWRFRTAWDFQRAVNVVIGAALEGQSSALAA